MRLAACGGGSAVSVSRALFRQLRSEGYGRRIAGESAGTELYPPHVEEDRAGEGEMPTICDAAERRLVQVVAHGQQSRDHQPTGRQPPNAFIMRRLYSSVTAHLQSARTLGSSSVVLLGRGSAEPDAAAGEDSRHRPVESSS